MIYNTYSLRHFSYLLIGLSDDFRIKSITLAKIMTDIEKIKPITCKMLGILCFCNCVLYHIKNPLHFMRINMPNSHNLLTISVLRNTIATCKLP